MVESRIQPVDEIAESKFSKPTFDPMDQRHADPPSGTMTRRTMVPLIDLLLSIGVPIHRRFVQNVLTFQGTQSPFLVSRMMNAVESLPGVYAMRRELIVNREPNHVLFRDEITPEEIAQLHSLIEYRQQIMRQDVLGPVAERFVRSCLKYSGKFSEVTPEAKLGYGRDRGGKNAVDIFATEKATGVRYAISVKKRR